MKTLTCLRPMPQTGTQDRKRLRETDLVRCLCGQPSCRDVDLKKDESSRLAKMVALFEVWTSDRFVGVRVGRRYLKVRDISRHPLRFSERNGLGYRRLVRVGMWEAGVKTDG